MMIRIEACSSFQSYIYSIIETMLKLYLLRHGQTQFNLEEIVQGWNDSPLTELGVFQAECTGYGLRDKRFEVAYCGDTGRQIATARAFLSQNLYDTQIIPDYHFREMNYGKFEGGTYYDMLSLLYKELDKPYANYDGLYNYYTDIEISNHLKDLDDTGQVEGSERAWLRLKEGLDMVTEKYREGNILISTSSIAIASIVHKLSNEVKQKGLVANASITIVSYDGQYHLEDYNNIRYREIGESCLLR